MGPSDRLSSNGPVNNLILRTGNDENGWNTIDFDVAPRKHGKYLRVQLNPWGRNLEVVLKDEPIRVHVNPIRGSLDMWESPIGSGRGMWIGSPPSLESPADNDPFLDQLFKRKEPPEGKRKRRNSSASR